MRGRPVRIGHGAAACLEGVPLEQPVGVEIAHNAVEISGRKQHAAAQPGVVRLHGARVAAPVEQQRHKHDG
jgi:hypothetical protein